MGALPGTTCAGPGVSEEAAPWALRFHGRGDFGSVLERYSGVVGREVSVIVK